MTEIRAGDVWQHKENCQCGKRGKVLVTDKSYGEVTELGDLLKGELMCCSGTTLIIPEQFVQHAVLALQGAGKLLWSSSVKTPPPQPDRCECGSAAVGSPRHSSWCPLSAKELPA